jgi:hypothetical protein
VATGSSTVHHSKTVIETIEDSSIDLCVSECLKILGDCGKSEEAWSTLAGTL